jgi:hypothetical protein
MPGSAVNTTTSNNGGATCSRKWSTPGRFLNLHPVLYCSNKGSHYLLYLLCYLNTMKPRALVKNISEFIALLTITLINSTEISLHKTAVLTSRFDEPSNLHSAPVSQNSTGRQSYTCQARCQLLTCYNTPWLDIQICLLWPLQACDDMLQTSMFK